MIAWPNAGRFLSTSIVSTTQASDNEHCTLQVCLAYANVCVVLMCRTLLRMTTVHEHSDSDSDSAGLSHSISFFASDSSVPHAMGSPHLDLHFPSPTHDTDSPTLDDLDAALFGHPSLASFDSALGLHPMLAPRGSMMGSTPEQDVSQPTETAAYTHQTRSPVRSQPAPQPRAQDASPPLQLQFILGPESQRHNDTYQHIPSAASLYQVVHPNVDDVIVNFDTKASPECRHSTRPPTE
jgi:hypothetical protein